MQNYADKRYKLKLVICLCFTLSLNVFSQATINPFAVKLSELYTKLN